MQFLITPESPEINNENKTFSSKQVIFLVFIITERFANDIQPVKGLSWFFWKT